MVLGEIVIALLTTLFVSLIFLFIFGYRGKWGNFWIFYLIVFSVTLFSTFWLGPNNNNYVEFSWIPIFFVSLITGGTLTSLTIPMRKSKKWNTDRSEKTTIIADQKMVAYSSILMVTLILVVLIVMLR
jgi:hypothetical protein